MAPTVGKRMCCQESIAWAFSILQQPGACTIDSESTVNCRSSKH